MRNLCGLKKTQHGQALTEYALLLVFIAGLGLMFGRYLPGLLGKLEKPIREDLRKAYRYGHPSSCGVGDSEPGCSGSPVLHPRYIAAGNFRLFARAPTK